jgi:hypothetical protein
MKLVTNTSRTRIGNVPVHITRASGPMGIVGYGAAGYVGRELVSSEGSTLGAVLAELQHQILQNEWNA